ncbi:unnamed protein product [Clonostachys solani]|uniref:Rhodopsin domain-containing protein n=1 Tax=Clonostachys solani TaxID=160281 RepID=A0A9P0EC80_9HYPO|nr:unnamed protein product [Clonostachys solani]
MARKEKFGIFVMFSLGIFITITSCIRLQYISRFGLSVNPTWDYTETIVWTGIELSVSIIVVCLPAMRKLTKRFIPWLASTISSASYGKDTTVFLQIFQCKPVQWAWLGWRLEYYRDRCSDVHQHQY